MSEPFVNAPMAKSLFSRALRGSAFTAGSYALAQGMRLISNLILTRLLAPEAFGVMAIVSVVLIGMIMFSDVGVSASISQSKRGDDPAFLNTAFTIHAFRGTMLWLVVCALAWPLSQFYNEPELVWLLPAAGLTLFIAGFNPTRIDTATRHLLLGRVTALDLLAQAIGIVAMVALALVFKSVWALVVGSIFGSLVKLALTWFFLPGERNRFHWDKTSGHELIHFGKWIFMSTACGFALAQGDKAIFGHYLTATQLGVYNIGFFLASFPLLLARAVNSRIMIPLYRDHHPTNSSQDFAKLRKLRFVISGGTLLLLGFLALVGVPLVGLLYDARYAAAGLIVVAVALVQMPETVGITYDQSALAAGDTKTYFWLQALKATVQTLAFLLGVTLGGLEGALLAQGIALLALHPAVVLLARKHRVWDPLNDVVFFGLVAVFVALALTINTGVFGL
ncbi:MAG: oligosaccharide flippase family protein [Cypionkella sp.]